MITPLKRLQPKLHQHRHADVMGGGVKQCQVYPKAFCQAVCAGTEAQKKLHNLGMRCEPIMNVEEMIAAMPKDTEESDPSRALHEDDAGYETWHEGMPDERVARLPRHEGMPDERAARLPKELLEGIIVRKGEHR